MNGFKCKGCGATSAHFVDQHGKKAKVVPTSYMKCDYCNSFYYYHVQRESRSRMGAARQYPRTVTYQPIVINQAPSNDINLFMMMSMLSSGSRSEARESNDGNYDSLPSDTEARETVYEEAPSRSSSDESSYSGGGSSDGGSSYDGGSSDSGSSDSGGGGSE